MDCLVLPRQVHLAKAKEGPYHCLRLERKVDGKKENTQRILVDLQVKVGAELINLERNCEEYFGGDLQVNGKKSEESLGNHFLLF